MQRRLPLFLLLLLALIPIAAHAADTDDNAAIIAAAKAYLNKEGYAKATKVKVEAVAKGFARVLVTPADGQTDPAIMFLQKKDGKWSGLTIGTGFAPDDLDELKIPEALPSGMSSAHESDATMAVFLDLENIAIGAREAQFPAFDIRQVLERLLLKGHIVVKKAYCDFDRYKDFKRGLHEAAFELIEIPHVRQSGKNSADIRMVVDALDLCYTKSHVDTFVIISGDSDFSPLVSKLRENAKKVIGMGVKKSTSDLFINNCDEFLYYDDLVRVERPRTAPRRRVSSKIVPLPAAAAATETPEVHGEGPSADRALEMVARTLEALRAERGDDYEIRGSLIKQTIKRRNPGFNERAHGFRAFNELLFEAQKRGLLKLEDDQQAGTYIVRPVD